MKVFLMHPDQDFDGAGKLPFNEAELTEDLALDVLLEAMADGDEYLLDTARRALLCGLGEPAAIRYRQNVLKDCLKNPDVVRELYRLPLQAAENKRRRWMGIFTRHPSGVLSSAVQLLEMFVDLLKRLRQIADKHHQDFESEGFQRFFAMVQDELDAEYFAVVEGHLKTLRFARGMLISAELGRANEGTNYTLREYGRPPRNWAARMLTRRAGEYTYTLHPRDDAGARALGELRDRGVNRVANAVAQSADHIDSFFNVLKRELAFYLGCLNLSEKLARLGEPVAFPEPDPVDGRTLSFTGLYDACLALTLESRVVGNKADASGKNLLVITGANQGGKSTFLRSLGLAQLMMQCGMFVPAESFRASVGTGLFTHFRREEDDTMTSGKFDEELGRMSAIVNHLTPGGIVLFNESFAATNEREGSEIARQIVSALLERDVRVFYVTHQYELAHGFYTRQIKNALFLRAERRADGQRTYRMVEGEPLKTSFGMDAYAKIFGAPS